MTLFAAQHGLDAATIVGPLLAAPLEMTRRKDGRIRKSIPVFLLARTRGEKPKICFRKVPFFRKPRIELGTPRNHLVTEEGSPNHLMTSTANHFPA